MGKNIRKTLNQFLIDLETKQPTLFKSIKILGTYINNRTPILIKTKYGNCLVTPVNLLLGKTPSIQSAVNKNEYFKNELKNKYPELLNNIEIIGIYKDANTHILIKTKYGNCSMRPYCLLKGNFPTILSAINKNEYFINRAKEVHGNLYDYSLVEYKNARAKVKIISSEGIFEQTPCGHLAGRGCQLLGYKAMAKYHEAHPIGWRYTNWEIAGNCSEHFDSFKVYIIKCYNDTECFYKIGKTYNTLKKRFNSKSMMPYSYEVIEILVSDARTISELEWELKNKNKEFKYKPLLKFYGQSECFTKY